MNHLASGAPRPRSRRPFLTPSAARLLLCGWGVLAVMGSPALRGAEPSRPALAYHSSIIGIESGLPNNIAEIVCQTSDGYLWIGTDDGLCRYDGVRIETYNAGRVPALPDDLIRTLVEDDAGTLWIGTQKGLCRYRNGHFERIPGLTDPVADLATDHQGHVWIATLGAGLLDYSDGQLHAHTGEPGLPPNLSVVRLLHDASGGLWISFRAHGLAYLSHGAFQSLPWAEAIHGEIGRIGQSADGSIWLAAADGIRRWRGGVLQSVGRAQGVPVDDNSVGFFTDAAGSFWIAAGQLYRSQTPAAEAFDRIAVTGVDTCRNLTQDREGSYWLGTAGAGFVRLRPSAFRLIPVGTGSASARAVAPAGTSRIWAAAASGGLLELGSDSAEVSVPPGKLATAGARSLHVDSQGRLWFGTRTELNCWDGQHLQTLPLADVRSIYEDRHGSLWFGPYGGGVFRYRAGRLESLAGQIGDAHSTLTAFAEDSAGTQYVGMDDGVAMLRGGIVSALDPKGAIPALQVRALYADAAGNLWVGTKRRGLVLFQQGRWYNPVALSEPFGDLVSALLPDGRGGLWLGTAHGIAWSTESEWLETAHGRETAGQIHFAGRNVGVPPSAVGYGSEPAVCRTADGTLWFATRLGVVSVRPDQISTNQTPPPVYVERVVVDGIAEPPSASVQLPPGTRSLAIDYTALSFAQPDAVQFRYQLVGHDPDWILAQNRRTAFYTDLAPGQYRFRVIACNNDGVWNETGASLSLVQRAWFYQTWWFYAAVGSVVLGSALGTARSIHHRRTAALRRENERLERGIAARTHELVCSEAALRTSQEKLSKAFHTQPDAICITRLRDGTYLEINSSFTQITGYTAAEVLGRDLRGEGGIWVHAPDRARMIAQLEAAGEVRGFEASFRRKDGSVLVGSLSARIMDVGGEPCVLAIVRDVTSQKELEEQLRQAHKMEAVGQLAGGVAHDYNNILTSTLMQLGLLLEGDEHSERTRAALRELEKDAKRAAGLTRQLLTFSRRQMMQVHPLELNGMLENLFNMLRRLLGENIELVFHRSSLPLTIQADVGMIEQVVTNLCVNARDAMAPAGGRLLIETSLQTFAPADLRHHPEGRPGAFACLTVSDTGCGMPPAVVKHLFEPFFTTKEFGHGTGLGLATIYGIIKQHQGWIDVASTPGAGSTFRVFVPAIGAPPAAEVAPLRPPDGRGRETILVVEDEAPVRQAVSRALTRCGYQVITAVDGQDAIARWDEHQGQIDLLFSDMVMPKGITGLDLAERFRRRRPELKVIVCSGYSVDLRKAGVPNDTGTVYLAKPFEMSVLAAAIRSCLDAAGPFNPDSARSAPDSDAPCAAPIRP